MSQLNLSIPQSGQPNSTEDPKVASDLTAIQGVINGGIDAGNITPGSLIGSLIAANTITPDKLTSGSGSAPFLKLATVGDHKVAWGTSVVGFGGVTQITGSIAHGLGATPAIAILSGGQIASTNNGGNPVPSIAAPTGWDGTNINFTARISDGGTSNNTLAIVWLAIA